MGVLSRQDDPSERGRQGGKGHKERKAVPDGVRGDGQAPENSAEAPLPRPPSPAQSWLSNLPDWGTSESPRPVSSPGQSLSSHIPRRNLENLRPQAYYKKEMWLEGLLQTLQPGECRAGELSSDLKPDPQPCPQGGHTCVLTHTMPLLV